MATVHIVPTEKPELFTYFSLFNPITDDSEPSEGRVGFCSFDKRVYSASYDGKIRGFVVYDYKLTHEESIKYGLVFDGSYNRIGKDSVEAITKLIDAERKWCEEAKS